MYDFDSLNGLKDSSPIVIEKEISLYLKGIMDVTSNNSYWKVADCGCYLGGDNLLTRKMMYRSICKKKSCPGSINNEKLFAGYILMPYIPRTDDSKLISINSLRATVAGYNDNPFLFIKKLEEQYNKGFKYIEGDDPLEVAICKTHMYWSKFGEGKDGFSAWREAFCLPNLEEYNIPETESFFIKSPINMEHKAEDWGIYQDLLKRLCEDRKKLIKIRIRGKV